MSPLSGRGLRFLAAGRHLQLGSNVNRDFGRIVVNKMSNAMVRNAPEFCPATQCANGGFFVFGKDSATAEPDNVSELILASSGI